MLVEAVGGVETATGLILDMATWCCMVKIDRDRDAGSSVRFMYHGMSSLALVR